MSRKKIGGRKTAPPSSSGDHNSRRGRLSALFGRGPEESDDTARYSTTSGKEMEPIKNGFVNSSEQSDQTQKSTDTHMDEQVNEVALDPSFAGVDAHRTSGGKKALKLDTTPPTNMTTADGFAEGFQRSSAGKRRSEDRLAADQTSVNDPAVDKVTQKVVLSILTPRQAAKSPIHRHKRASGSFKIVDRTSADAVLLPAMSYNPSSHENRASIYSNNHDGAESPVQEGLSDQPSSINQKQLDEVQILPSTTYSMAGFPSRNYMEISRSDKDIGEGTHLLPSTTYIPSEAMCSIPEASRHNILSKEKRPLMFSNPHVESELTLNNLQADEAPAKGDHSPSSTFHVVSTPLPGVLKVNTSDKLSADKKVRFLVTPSSRAIKAEDNSGYSDDANQTIKRGVDDMKTVPESILSPVIWDKGSEPKIWLKDGKPTLFKPKKEPGYYTDPLWSRQYPDIFSNEERMGPRTADYAGSTTSTDGSQYSETSASNSNANSHPGSSLQTNTGPNTDMSFGAGASTPHAASTNIPGGVNTLPTPASQTFVGRDFPEHNNTLPGFAQTPRYRTQVKIEVGGRRFVTTFEVLEKSPWFRHLFSIDFRNWYHDGVFHIDNDGDLFAHILRYLRTGLYPLFWDARNGFDYAMYAMIKQQAHHYMLYDLEAWIKTQKFHDIVETQVIHQKVLVPHSQEWIHEQHLMGNQSYVISGVVEHANPRNHFQRDAQAAAAGHCQSNNGETYGPKRNENGIEALNAGIGSAVVLFTTEKVVKVDMDQLRRV
ncbi:hypothetical protein LZ30DRAFT_707891 [Colletotrichum cereale]|nr:hypothetical protein LZ30DRAFT_707891 [Colletotrichum cereale]